MYKFSIFSIVGIMYSSEYKYLNYQAAEQAAKDYINSKKKEYSVSLTYYVDKKS